MPSSTARWRHPAPCATWPGASWRCTGSTSIRACSSPTATSICSTAMRVSSSARDEVAALHQRVTALRAERDTLQLDERQKLARLDLLTFQRDEIEKAGLRAGEDEALEAERQVLANAEKLQRLSAEAYELLYERDEAVLSALNAVWKRVAGSGGRRPACAAIPGQPRGRRLAAGGPRLLPARLRRAHRRLARADCRTVDDRVGLLDRLKRKYGPGLSDVIAHAETCRAGLDALQSSDERAAEVATLAARRRRRVPASAPSSCPTRAAQPGGASPRSWCPPSATSRWAARGSKCGSRPWRQRPGAPEDLTK